MHAQHDKFEEQRAQDTHEDKHSRDSQIAYQKRPSRWADGRTATANKTVIIEPRPNRRDTPYSAA